MTVSARKAFEEALALEHSGDLDKALVSYLKAQELSPQDSEIAYRTASALLQSGYLEEAQSQLRRIVFAQPDNLNARASLGNCQLLLGDTENAALNFRDVLSQIPENRNALYGLASVCLKDCDFQEAATIAKQLLEQLPESPAVLALFAETQAKTGQTAAAIAVFRKALKGDPENVQALLGLADVLLKRKRYDEVVELTIRTNQLAPTDPLALELLSDALAGKGSLEDAREAAEAALKVQPDSQSILVRLSILARKLGDHASALKFALQAHEQNDQAQDPLNALGAALAALKHQEEARSVLTGLARGEGLDPKVRGKIEELIAAIENQRAQAEETEQSQPLPPLDATQEIASNSANDLAVHPGDIDNAAPKEALQLTDEATPTVLGLQRRDNT